MKLNSRQIDVLVNEIYKRIHSDPKYLGTDPESEKSVNELFEAYKQTDFYKKVKEVLDMDPSNNKVTVYGKLYTKQLGIADKVSDVSCYFYLNSQNLDENAISNIRRAFMKKAPSKQEIEDKLILDSIFIDKDTEIEEFIANFVQKITA